MASIAIGDVVIPSVFNEYVLKETEVKSKLIQSGVLVRSAELDSFLAGGGTTLNKPTWKDLDSTAEKVANDTTSVLFGGTTLVPLGTTTYNEIAVRLTRTQQWAASKLAGELAGDDPMAAIGQRVAAYDARTLQDTFLAEMTGLFLDNDAAADVGDTHTAGDLTFDASAASFVAGVTNFTAENLFDALQTAGDSQEDFKILCVHSAVFSRMRKNDLIDFIPDSVTGASLATFQGLQVIYDDKMPKSGNVYQSYIFAPGALELGYGNPERATEVAWMPEAGNGYGEEVLFRRRSYCIHPMGHAYIGSVALNQPTNTTLALAASWSRKCPERKQVKIARLITREA